MQARFLTRHPLHALRAAGHRRRAPFTTTMAQTTASSSATSQWHDAYPTPPFNSPRISAESLAEIINKKVAGVDYIVVDVRRTDFEASLDLDPRLVEES
jgi:hypothetical protein